MYSGDPVGSPHDLPETPKRIIGYGSSPMVQYNGRGLYFIEIKENSVDIELLPHARFVRNWWEWHTDGEPIVELDTGTAMPFELKLSGFEGISFEEKPGKYRFPLVVKSVVADKSVSQSGQL